MSKRLMITILFLLISVSGVAANVFITEIMAEQHPSGQWIELYNSGSATVDLKDFTINNNDFDDIVIQPKFFAIVAGSFDSFEAFYGNNDTVWNESDGNYSVVSGNLVFTQPISFITLIDTATNVSFIAAIEITGNLGSHELAIVNGTSGYVLGPVNGTPGQSLVTDIPPLNTTLPANNAPSITSTAVTTATVNTTYTYDVNAVDQDNEQLTYTLTKFPAGMVIDTGTGIITWTPTATGRFDVIVQASDGKATANQSFSITVNTISMLSVSNIKVKVDGKKKTVLPDGIIRSVKPGSSLEVTVELKNMFEKSSNIDIEDIELEVTIFGVKDKTDLEENEENINLDANEDKEFAFDFRIPYDAKDKDYTMQIKAAGTDSNNNVHSLVSKVFLGISKKSHELKLTRAELSTDTISCGNAIVDIEAVNVGSTDEDATLTVTAAGLGLNAREEFDLDEGDRYTKSYTIKPQKPGTYPITVKLSYDSALAEDKSLLLTINRCETAQQAASSAPEVIIQQQGPSGMATGGIPGPQMRFVEDGPAGTEWLFIIAAVLFGAVLLIGAYALIIR